ncbi:hypothetical protein HHK36_016639 [Tetracentron sinense]|uniref:Uncharacterized protein n=1 Tax=Tetracentron sinense TaxID=13715 RepID=A0A834Z659_TETSI|nr:hypothetical protein HHK36_016639 [Tetracentron sinense]
MPDILKQMMGNERGKCDSGTVIDASINTFTSSNEKANRLTYKLVRVEGDGSFVPALEDELIEVEHLLAEPKNEKVSVDSALCLEMENPEKCLAIEDFPCTVECGQIKNDRGALDPNSIREEEEESKLEFLDGMLQGVDEEGDLHVTNSLSGACEDYLLDTEFAEEVSNLNYGPCEGSCMGNLGLESHFPGLSGRDNGAAEISELSTATIPVPESISGQNCLLLDKMTIRELHEAFRSTFGRETSVKDKQWLKNRISFGLQNLVELENVSSLWEGGISSNENEGHMILTTSNDSSGRMFSTFTNVLGNRTKPVGQVVDRDLLTTSSAEAGKVGNGLLNMGDREGSLLTRKRLRKPTRRYIEESSDLKSRNCSGRLETPSTSLRDRFLQFRSHNQHHRTGFGVMPMVTREEALGGAGIQVPFSLRERKGRPKKNTSILGNETEDIKDRRHSIPNRNSNREPSLAESQDDMSDDCVTMIRTEKGGRRRKHHRLWTLSEVMKLIDGVSQYGVGRWTEIKRLLFSSSAYRTSVDLKDKWRNLLRASCTQLQSKREMKWDSQSDDKAHPDHAEISQLYPRKKTEAANKIAMQAEQGRKHASRPIPSSVLRRVSELALIYPYPRERKTKLSRSAPFTSATTSSGTPVSRTGRITHRKSVNGN